MAQFRKPDLAQMLLQYLAAHPWVSFGLGAYVLETDAEAHR